MNSGGRVGPNGCYVPWSDVLGPDGSAGGIVLTHGAGGDSGHWDALRPHLSRYRVVRWDLPGHGRSPVLDDPGGYDRDLCLDALAALAILAGEGAPVVPVGHSFGGYLGLAYAILQPQAVRGLVLVATGPGFRSERSRQRWNRGVDAYAARLELPAARLARQEDSLVLARLAEVVLPFLDRLT